eukprot:560776-Pelagomonas_calceolata.AAC.3
MTTQAAWLASKTYNLKKLCLSVWAHPNWGNKMRPFPCLAPCTPCLAIEYAWRMMMRMPTMPSEPKIYLCCGALLKKHGQSLEKSLSLKGGA